MELTECSVKCEEWDWVGSVAGRGLDGNQWRVDRNLS